MNHSILNTISTCLFFFIASISTAHAALHECGPTIRLRTLRTFLHSLIPIALRVSGVGCEADPIELIVALTINPFATGAEQFSEDVVYHFYFENESGARAQIDCSFSADQVVSCAGMGGLSAEARVGQIGVNGDLRVYAGLRDNPVSFDLDALESFTQIGHSRLHWSRGRFVCGIKCSGHRDRHQDHRHVERAQGQPQCAEDLGSL